MADEMVLATQKWLNKTYGHIPEFDKCPEDGKTGWPTIYSLIEGLQIELGIPHENLSPNFGPTTSQKFDEQVTPNLIAGYKGNVVYLIQGAFWCKGIGPAAFDGVYSNYTREAVMKFQGYAGFDPDGILTSMWAAALFDMSAFVLVPGGDAKVRQMQQWLNVDYFEYFGILPCDGNYQRDTNIALIYALQAEVGMSPDKANGVYGPGTTSLTPTLKEGDWGAFVTILKYALYVNGFLQNGNFESVLFSSDVGDAVEEFRKFMILQPYNRIADIPVIKGLLSSAGDTSRWATGADTSTQLTPTQIQTLVKEDVQIIGRYLTGTVGVGEDERDKFLTTEELSNLFDAGMSVFPIYQDGGWYIDYFSAFQGASDANVAGQTARSLGIPVGTAIYFAVDLDIQDGDIAGTILPYFEAISSVIKGYGYQVGVYGTRNVCNRVVGAGYAHLAFVSDMSTGFSGNLGFPMPRQWAFDQFIEFTIGSGDGAVAIDNNAVSGRDLGFNRFEDNKLQEIRAKLMELGDILPILKNPAIGTISFEQEYMIKSGPYNVYVQLTENANTDSGTGANIIHISNGSISNDLTEKLNRYYGIIVLPLEQQKIEMYNLIASKMKSGEITVSPAHRPEEPNNGIETIYRYIPEDGTQVLAEWRVQVFLRRDTVEETQPNDISAYNMLLNISNIVAEASDEVNLIRIFETFASMNAQTPDNYSHTIAAGGMIATFGAVMLALLVLV